MPLAAVHILEVVAAPLLAAGTGVDRLAVDAGAGARVVGLLGRAGLRAEPIVGEIQGAVAPPLVEVPPDGALGREVLGEIAPLAAGAGDVEDGVDDLPQVGLAGPAAAGFRWQMGFEEGPLVIGEVTRVMV